MKAVNLQTNYRKNPLGIDGTRLRFSWNCEGGVKQTAYQVTARTEDGRILFDSDRVESDKMHCMYAGEKTVSGQRIIWQVRLWDEAGTAEDSESAWLEIGLLRRDDWRADWISGIGTATDDRLPADCYRKTFRVDRPVVCARLYASACGVYSAAVNGVRLPGVLAPGCTEYDKRLYYQTYDITGLLQSDNTVTFTVADGWYKGKLGSSNTQNFFGNQLKLLAQVELRYADGEQEIIGTDESWDWCNDGPILYSDLKDGEIYDSRKTPGYGSHAQKADCEVIPTASPAAGIAEHEHFSPVVLHSPSGAFLLDFGQNIAGYIQFTVNGKRGQVIRLRMCEVLDHGEYSNATLLHELPDLPSTNQEIIFTCAGGKQVFRPEFFYSGFRYAMVEGLEEVNREDFEAVAVYSELSFESDFYCSNEKINQFLRNTRWSQKSNFVDIPTDCPQREKSGWTGDAQVFVKTALYLSDPAAFYKKWLRDVRDCQRADGRVDNVCPKIRGMESRDVLNGAVGWADAAVIIPYTLWKTYGDVDFIRENYPLMHGWKEYMIQAAADKSIYHLPDNHNLKPIVTPFLLPDSPYNKYVVESGLHWGEWCEPDAGASPSELVRPKQELTAAYMHYSMTLLSEMLTAIGYTEEAAQCDEYAAGGKAAYNEHFVKDGEIQAPRQAPMVRALALGLLDEETQKSVAAKLNQSAINRNYTVGTGFLSTPFVLQTLVKYGYTDTAYRMLENTTAPGWLAMVEKGATTVWENYDLFDEAGHPMKSSMNHYSLGSVCSFLFEVTCGLRIRTENEFEIVPLPGGTLTDAHAKWASPYGTVQSEWVRHEGKTRYTVSLPANTHGTLILPDGTRYPLTAGIFTVESI